MNIIQIIGTHSPLLAAALEHNKVVQINPENIKTAINELLKTVLQKYTNRIVENAKVSIIDIPIGHDFEFTDTVNIVNKESITSQLPEFLKEIRI